MNGFYTPSKGGDPAARSRTATLLRLRPNHPPHLHYPPPIRLAKIISGADGSHGVTGGVYKVRERIHRIVLIYDY